MPPPRSLEPAEGEVVAIGGWRWKEGCPFEGGGEELGSAPWGEVEARRVEDLPDQGYRLRVAGREAVIEAGSATGFRYGWVTLGQWTRAHRKGVPPVRIEDWPDFPVRGIMLDISRNKVPTMAALKELVREVAGWKINHLQLYTEHTFAYRNHREVWKDASPMTAEEIRDLAGWCREWGIELAPNQNCFGHLTTWLKLPGYRHLAECPEGFVTPWGERRKGPFSLNPLHPGSLKLVEEWLDELLPLFESGRVNVGCDETFDLGQGASAEACRERGKGRVYLEYVKRLEELVSKRGFRMMFWGDIILKHPELIPELPQEVIALNWGYEANHPFEKECAAFAEAGVPFWVCPGTSMWNSITGRHGNAMANLEGAAREGRRHGAEGFLITEWGDNGHWQPWTFSRIPLLAGAGFGWNGEGMATVDLAGVVAAEVAGVGTAGRAGALLDLAESWSWPEVPMHNGSILFHLLHREDPGELVAQLSRDKLRGVRERLEGVRRDLDGAGAVVAADVEVAVGLLDLACLRGLAWMGEDGAEGQLKVLLPEVIAQFRRVWLSGSRPGGLEESLIPLGRILSG